METTNKNNCAKYITPEIEDLIEIYQQSEILGDMLYRHQLASIEHTAIEDKEDAAIDMYNRRYSGDIKLIQEKLERDIMSAIIDNISIFGTIEFDKLKAYEERYKKTKNVKK